MKLWKSKLKSLTGNMRLLHRSYKMDNSWWKYMMIVLKNIIYQISSYTNEICVLVTKQLSHINSIWYCIRLVTLVSLVLFVLAGINQYILQSYTYSLKWCMRESHIQISSFTSMEWYIFQNHLFCGIENFINMIIVTHNIMNLESKQSVA